MDVLLIILGVIIGVFISTVIYTLRTDGTVRVDQSDPTEEPYLFLELDKPVNEIISKHHVTFKVIVKNYISQK